MAALQREAELAEKLGDDAPDMDAANLHPWAWESGASYWNSGHFHQAVMQAAIRINFETQTKSGRMDLSETALFNDAFSLDASKEGAPRLRLAEDDGGKTYQNLHRGARAFADGLYTAIRNPGMHTPPPADGGEQQLALEQLAAFSSRGGSSRPTSKRPDHTQRSASPFPKPGLLKRASGVRLRSPSR